MTTPWGRTSEAGVWPRPKPVWTLAALLLALASGVAIGQYRYARVWSPLQQVDASAYLRSAIASTIGFATSGRYHLLHVVTPGGGRLPINEEVDRIEQGPESVLTLSPSGQAAGDERLVWLDTSVRHAGLYRFLRQWVYTNQTPLDLLMPAVWGALGTFAAGLLIAVPRDLKRTRDRREGRRLRGPQLVTPAQFNRRMRRLDRRRRSAARGLAIALEPNPSAHLLRRRPVVRLPRSLESSHLLLMGDSGTGKSMIIRQLLNQIRARGESAVIYDPALEFTPEFYDLARGDVILNPLDARCPYWTPSDEVEHEAEAMTIATSLYPGEEGDSPEREFFTRTPRQIFAHLLSYRPGPHELARWMSDDNELDRRLAGTPYAKFIDPKSPHQRNGVLASLNLAANALLLLPAERDTTARWSAAAWAKDRRGWVFLTSTPPTRDRIRPLTSLWLDTVVLRLMSGDPGPRPTWFILDELGSLQRLPQLHTAVTENRKSNNPIVLGFQGRSQLESRYGHDAEAMLAQPATKIFLRTNEAHAAKWIADTIGHIEIERLVETRANRGSREQSYTLTRQIEPLVMDSEITGFSNLRGLLKIGNFVVRLEIPFVEPVKRTAKFLQRPGLPRVVNGTPPPDPAPFGGPTDLALEPERPPLEVADDLMLTISKPLSAGQARRYHAEEFRNARENYYTAGDQIHGHWHGQLAREWGLSGEVDQTQFERLAEGRHPITDEVLVHHQTARMYTNAKGDQVETMEHRAGWDATFSAPKSVSLTALVGGDDRVREAHRASVEVALDEIEQYVQARIGRNHPAETTGKWVAATFEHDSARPVDGYAAPQLHTHVVIFNLTETAEGETHALQPRELYRAQQFGTAVYRSEMATHLPALGYEIERGQSGQPEIRGYTPEYLEASSPRRHQIQAHLAQEEQRGAGPAQIAAHHTREAKLDHSHDDMQHRHQAMAAAFGDQPAHVVEAARARAHDLGQEPPRISAHAAVTYARDRNFEREAVVGERDLLRDALTRSMGEVTFRDVKVEFEHRVETGDFIRVNRTPESPGRAFTTPEMIQLEHDTVAAMRAGQQQHSALVDGATTDRLAREHPHLSERQHAAVEQILASRDQVMALDGVAGAGKTTVLSVVREAAERDGYQVEGFAPTSRAAQQLETAGMPAITLQRHLAKLEELEPAPKHLYVLDESSLASTTQMHAFLERLQPDDRILLVGDVRQHEAVDAGRPYHQLQAAGMDTAHLDDIVRQRDPALKAVVEQLARGEVPAALQQLDQQGRVHEIADRGERLRAMAREYVANPDRTLVVSPDNQSRREINDVIHRERQAAGQVDREDHVVRVLVPRQDLTGADRQWAARYEPGDVVRYTTGSRVYGLSAAEYARVEHVDGRDNHVSVSRGHGENVTYDPRRLQGVTVYREADRQFAVGDRVQVTAPDRERHLANRELGTIEGIDHTHPDRALQVRLDSGRAVTFSGESPLHLDYGYAVTSHSSQGQTADRVLVHVDTARAGEALVNERFAYVALSRSRFDAQVYTNDKKQLTQALSREHSHHSAIEPGHALGPTAHGVESSVALGSPGHHF